MPDIGVLIQFRLERLIHLASSVVNSLKL